MDSEFASRIASLERSIGAVSNERERYLSSAVTGAFTRGTQQNSSAGHAGGGGGGGFRVTFPADAGNSLLAADDAMTGKQQQQHKHYDPAAVAQHSSLRHYQKSASLLSTPPDYNLHPYSAAGDHRPYQEAAQRQSYQQHGYEAAALGGDQYVVVDPYSEAFSVCPRCVHLQKLEESLAVVDDQYRAELEHLRRMVAQVDADRLDVVQRLRLSQDDIETLRSQVLEKERQSSEWRQRATVAEEELNAAQRVNSSAQWEWERRVVFALETIMFTLASTESDARLNLIACEQASRTALWSVADAGQLELRRHKQIEKLRREQERLATKTLTMHEVEAEYRRAMDEAVTASQHAHLSQRSAESGAAHQSLLTAPGGGRQRTLAAVSSTLSSALLTQSRNIVSDLPQGANSRSNSQQPSYESAIPAVALKASAKGAKGAADATKVGDSDGVAAPQLLQRCLSDPKLTDHTDLQILDFRDSNSPDRGGDQLGAVDDVSFGDLELEDEDNDLLGVKQSLTSAMVEARGGGGNVPNLSPSSELQRWQKLLAESDNARRQLEGHLLTEQHFSNELQIEVDDLTRREDETSESYRRAKLETSEVQFRLEIVLQSHRRLEGRVATMMSSAGLTDRNAGSGSQLAASMSAEDVQLLEKELKVLRQLYTSAKEDAIAARKEVEVLELSRKDSMLTAPPALHNTLRPPEEDEDTRPLPGVVVDTKGSTRQQTTTTAVPGKTPLSSKGDDIPAAPSAKLIAEEVLRLLQPQLSLMTDSLANVSKQLSVSDDLLVPALAGGTTAEDTQQYPPTQAPHRSSSPTLESVLEAPPVVVRKQPQSSFASLLLERVQNAAQVHQSAVRNMLESSMHGTDVRIAELSEQIRSSLRPTPNVSLMETSTTIPAGGAGGVAPHGATSLGSVTPNDYLSQSSTPRVLGPAPPPSAESQQIPTSLLSPTGASGLPLAHQQQQSSADPIALSKLQDALASMRNIMRNVLFTTSHNQKLIGEKLDDLTIGQRALMSEWNTTASSLLETSQRQQQQQQQQQQLQQYRAFSPQSGSSSGGAVVMMSGGGAGAGGSPTYITTPTFQIGRQVSDSVVLGSPNSIMTHHQHSSPTTAPTPILQNTQSFRQPQHQQQQHVPTSQGIQSGVNESAAQAAFQYSVPPALQEKALAAAQAKMSAVSQSRQHQQQHAAEADHYSEQASTQVIDQFVLEEAMAGHAGSRSGAGQYLEGAMSPPAPPLPQFAKVSSVTTAATPYGVAVPPAAVMIPQQYQHQQQQQQQNFSYQHQHHHVQHGQQTYYSGGGGGGPRSGSPGGASGHQDSGRSSSPGGSSGLPPLQRRASHRWDEDEDEEHSPVAVPTAAVTRTASAATAQRSWKKVKNPYSDSD